MLYVYRPGSAIFSQMVGNVVGKGGATSYESGAGTYYLDIEADENYTVTVQTKASKTPRQPAYAWKTVRTLSGTSTLTTAPMALKSPWRIVWTSRPGSIGSGNFAVDVEKPGSSLPVSSFANVVGADHGTTFEYRSGTFDLSVNADEAYSMKVQESK